jgi:hypothetical protein
LSSIANSSKRVGRLVGIGGLLRENGTSKAGSARSFVGDARLVPLRLTVRRAQSERGQNAGHARGDLSAVQRFRPRIDSRYAIGRLNGRFAARLRRFRAHFRGERLAELCHERLHDTRLEHFARGFGPYTKQLPARNVGRRFAPAFDGARQPGRTPRGSVIARGLLHSFVSVLRLGHAHADTTRGGGQAEPCGSREGPRQGSQP